MKTIIRMMGINGQTKSIVAAASAAISLPSLSMVSSVPESLANTKEPASTATIMNTTAKIKSVRLSPPSLLWAKFLGLGALGHPHRQLRCDGCYQPVEHHELRQ